MSYFKYKTMSDQTFLLALSSFYNLIVEIFALRCINSHHACLVSSLLFQTAPAYLSSLWCFWLSSCAIIQFQDYSLPLFSEVFLFWCILWALQECKYNLVKNFLQNILAKNNLTNMNLSKRQFGAKIWPKVKFNKYL